jgi:hypothetical protein
MATLTARRGDLAGPDTPDRGGVARVGPRVDADWQLGGAVALRPDGLLRQRGDAPRGALVVPAPRQKCQCQEYRIAKRRKLSVNPESRQKCQCREDRNRKTMETLSQAGLVIVTTTTRRRRRRRRRYVVLASRPHV